MATQTLRPNGTVINSPAWTRVGGTTKHGVLSDDSDATYLETNGSPTDADVFDLTSYVLAADERVKRVRCRFRHTPNGAGVVDIRTEAELSSPAQLWASLEVQSAAAGASPATAEGAWHDTTEVVTQAQIDALRLELRCLDTVSGSRCYEAYVVLDVWQPANAPTVSTDPAGPTITDTDLPTIEFYTSSRNDGSPHLWSQQVRIFRDEVYLAAGFDPETETDVEWEKFEGAAGVASVWAASPDTAQVDDPLTNSDTYRAYVRYGKNDVGGEVLWSDWGHVEFTLNLTLPTPPALNVTVDQANGRQTVVVTTAALTHDTLERLRVQRSDDGGTTWATIRGGMITADPADGSALAGSTAYTFHDYDAPRDTVLQYRARVTEGRTTQDATLTSTWTTDGPHTHANDGSWWLYDVGRWTAVLGGARITGLPEIEIRSDQGVFYPLGRDGEAVVVTGASHGDDGEYTLKGTGAAEAAAVDAIARFNRTVLVKSPFGDQKYVRWLTGKSMQLAGTPARPQHRWTLPYVEVGSGIGTDG